MLHGPRACELADPGPLRERLVEAVLAGEKSATSSLLAQWDHDREPLPTAGEHQTVVDSDTRPVAIIELLEVDVIRLGDIDLQLVLAEGEGFRSVGEWRRAHERFWAEEAMPSLLDDRPQIFDDDTLVVVERFRLLSRQTD